jgi:hypothetical protein
LFNTHNLMAEGAIDERSRIARFKNRKKSNPFLTVARWRPASKVGFKKRQAKRGDVARLNDELAIQSIRAT